MSRVFDNNLANYIRGTFSPGLTQSITIFCWAKETNWAPTRDCFIGLSDDHGVDEDFSLMVRASNASDQFNVQVTDSAGSGTSVTAGTPNEWNAVWVPCMGVFSGAANFPITAYIEDAAQTSTSSPNRDAGTIAELVLGQNVNGSSHALAGSLAEITVWDGILTSGNFTTLASGGAGGNGANPTTVDGSNIKGYWSLRTTALTDESGNSGPTLSVTGTVAWDADHPNVDEIAVAGGLPGYHGLNRGIGRGLFRGLG